VSARPHYSLFGMPESRLFPAFILAASVGVLGTAFFFQYVLGLKPCILCILQRIPYATTIALSLIALLLARGGRGGQGWVMALCAPVFLVGAGIAAFHVGVEQHWWQGTSACQGGTTAGANLAEVLAQAQAAPEPRCDQIPWELFGISMAGYNVPVSLGLAAISAFAAVRLLRSRA